MFVTAMLSALVTVQQLLEWVSRYYLTVPDVTAPGTTTGYCRGKTYTLYRTIRKRSKDGRVILTYSQQALNQINREWNKVYAEQTTVADITEGTVPRRRVTWSEIPSTRSNRFGLYHFDANSSRIFTTTDTENGSEE